MKSFNYLILSLFLLFQAGCITEFIPATNESKESLVVEGLITDQYGSNTVKLSKSVPLGIKNTAKPLKGCTVMITDDAGNTYRLSESKAGTYKTDSTKFIGQVGRKYVLYINTNNSTSNHYSYQSLPMEMTPVPSIDSLYYERKTITEKDEYNPKQEGCQVYLDTYDPEGTCRYFRWNYVETWEIRLPYPVTNHTCWVTNKSSSINIKNTTVLSEDRIIGHSLNFVSNATDRLKVKYSMLVDQYSISEEEFSYWEKLQNVSQEVGSLYDVTPATISGNVYCIDDPSETVLGYFSVSAKASKRIFIDDNFMGIVNLYTNCPSDTIYGNNEIPDIGSSVWVIMEDQYAMPPYRILTDKKYCADCTTRGTTTEPDFWNDDKLKKSDELEIKKY